MLETSINIMKTLAIDFSIKPSLEIDNLTNQQIRAERNGKVIIKYRKNGTCNVIIIQLVNSEYNVRHTMKLSSVFRPTNRVYAIANDKAQIPILQIMLMMVRGPVSQF
jgi:hypothetical protein